VCGFRTVFYIFQFKFKMLLFLNLFCGFFVFSLFPGASFQVKGKESTWEVWRRHGFGSFLLDIHLGFKGILRAWF
jgi:hypothetical protein